MSDHLHTGSYAKGSKHIDGRRGIAGGNQSYFSNGGRPLKEEMICHSKPLLEVETSEANGCSPDLHRNGVIYVMHGAHPHPPVLCILKHSYPAFSSLDRSEWRLQPFSVGNHRITHTPVLTSKLVITAPWPVDVHSNDAILHKGVFYKNNL